MGTEPSESRLFPSANRPFCCRKLNFDGDGVVPDSNKDGKPVEALLREVLMEDQDQLAAKYHFDFANDCPKPGSGPYVWELASEVPDFYSRQLYPAFQPSSPDLPPPPPSTPQPEARTSGDAAERRQPTTPQR